jgi:hypothetical protein
MPLDRKALDEVSKLGGSLMRKQQVPTEVKCKSLFGRHRRCASAGTLSGVDYKKLIWPMLRQLQRGA